MPVGYCWIPALPCGAASRATSGNARACTLVSGFGPRRILSHLIRLTGGIGKFGLPHGSAQVYQLALCSISALGWRLWMMYMQWTLAKWDLSRRIRHDRWSVFCLPYDFLFQLQP